MKLPRLKTIKAEFPVISASKFLSKKTCKKIINEINNFNEFDDYVMSGRNRINKGSNNFKLFISNSKNAKKLYKIINNRFFYKELKNIFDKNHKLFEWRALNVSNKFSKSNFGFQSGKKLTNTKSSKKKVNLDFDFSASENGYYRTAHRDRPTRLINFLIYLNNIPKKFGGALQIYSLKKNLGKNFNNYSRFPNKKDVKISKTFQPEAGRAIFFISSPNSYHGVSRLYSKNNSKRYFLYGSYSLDRAVKWGYIRNKKA